MSETFKHLVPAIEIDPSLARYKNAFPEKLALANERLKNARFPASIPKKQKLRK